MPYLIDGHNLIPKIPGLSLRDIDDEEKLIILLQEFCRMQRKSVEVYFDNAPPGQSRTQKYGAVSAHFVRQGATADDAIRTRLKNLGKEARNWTVVSSDQAVQSSAKFTGAQVITASEFTSMLIDTIDEHPEENELNTGEPIDQDDLSYWLDVFNSGEESAGAQSE